MMVQHRWHTTTIRHVTTQLTTRERTLPRIVVLDAAVAKSLRQINHRMCSHSALAQPSIAGYSRSIDTDVARQRSGVDGRWTIMFDHRERCHIIAHQSPWNRRRRHQYQQQQQQQTRTIISWDGITEILPSVSVWGGSGWLIKFLHNSSISNAGTSPDAAAASVVGVTTGLPYWACFAVMSILLRVTLFPVLLYGAQTASRFAKVIPELQFVLTLFQNDMSKLRQRQQQYGDGSRRSTLIERMVLMRMNLQTVGGIYKLHNINPFSVFLSPLLQLPVFWYVSVDMRKIVNGLDPLLAQDLVDSTFFWLSDLTEPDPWYGLPILAGVALYGNLEAALGRRSLSGPATAKSNTGLVLKDLFQSFAVFMPCFTSHLPAGIQIYIVTSFFFTVVQSAALRNEHFRRTVGLPSMMAPPPEAKYAAEFIALKQLEQKAREIRGDGPVLGRGVLAVDLEVSFPGDYRPSSIQGGGGPTRNFTMPKPVLLGGKPLTRMIPMVVTNPLVFLVHGVMAPPWQIEEQRQADVLRASQEAAKAAASQGSTASNGKGERQYMPHISDEMIEKANRGEIPMTTKFIRDLSSDASYITAASRKLTLKPAKHISNKRKSRFGKTKKR